MNNFLDALQDSICLIDEGYILYMNKEMRQILGYALEEVIGRPIQEVLSFKEEEEHTSICALTKGKRYKRGNCHFESILVEGKRLESCIIKWKDLKREKLSFLEHLLDAIGDSICIKDREGNYIFVNETYAKGFNLLKEDIIGKNITDFWTPEQCKQARLNETLVFNSGKKQRGERKYEINGTVDWFETTGYPLYDHNEELKYIGTVKRNITVFKNLQYYVLESEKQFNQLQESYIFNQQPTLEAEPLDEIEHFLKSYFKTNQFELWLYNEDKKALQAYFREGALVGNENRDIFPMSDEEIKKFLHNDYEVIKRTNKYYVSEQEYIYSEEPFYLIRHGIIYRGEFLGILALMYKEQVTDFNMEYYLLETICNQIALIIKNKKLKDALMQSLEYAKELITVQAECEKALQLEHMKGEFFANLSHEFKTPLAIILAAIKLMDEEIFRDGEESIPCKKYAKAVRQNSYRLLKLVNNLIDISKIDAGYYKLYVDNYNIVYVVEEIVLSIVEYGKDSGVEIIFDTEVEEEIIACDPDKIERIMLNLISNAIKYAKLPGHIEVNLRLEESHVVISVKDNGIGIPKEKLTYIFERFSQANQLLTRTREGSGIGLSITKALVELHEGTIEVSSTVGEGSTFEIRLPRKQVKGRKPNEEPERQGFESKFEKCNIEFSDIYNTYI